LANGFPSGIEGLIPFGIGAALFALGSRERSPENLVAGAFGVIVGVIMTVVYWLPGNILQGLAIIACGVALLLVLRTQLARANQLKLGEPTA
jgi:Flp pilus assembly protein TadB